MINFFGLKLGLIGIIIWAIWTWIFFQCIKEENRKAMEELLKRDRGRKKKVQNG